MKATRARRGATSLSIASHFPIMPLSYCIIPVRSPPGRAKLATRPEATGSETPINTIGIERVCCFSATAAGVDSESITSGWSAANSFANNGY